MKRSIDFELQVTMTDKTNTCKFTRTSNNVCELRKMFKESLEEEIVKSGLNTPVHVLAVITRDDKVYDQSAVTVRLDSETIQWNCPW